MSKQYFFEKFNFINKRRSMRGVTVRKSASIAFPSAFYHENNLKNFNYVVLYLDKKQQSIGIHFCNDKDEKNKYRITGTKGGFGGYITAHSFFIQNNIDPKKSAGEYPWEKVIYDGKELFVINLNEKK